MLSRKGRVDRGTGPAIRFGLLIAFGLAAGCQVHNRAVIQDTAAVDYATLTSDGHTLEIVVRGRGEFNDGYRLYTSRLSVAVRYNPNVDSCGYAENEVAAWFDGDSMNLEACNYLSSRIQDNLVEYVYLYTFTCKVAPYRLPADVNGRPLPVPVKLYFGGAAKCAGEPLNLDTALIYESGAYDYRRSVF